jgi:hypothetical protein
MNKLFAGLVAAFLGAFSLHADPYFFTNYIQGAACPGGVEGHWSFNYPNVGNFAHLTPALANQWDQLGYETNNLLGSNYTNWVVLEGHSAPFAFMPVPLDQFILTQFPDVCALHEHGFTNAYCKIIKGDSGSGGFTNVCTNTTPIVIAAGYAGAFYEIRDNGNLFSCSTEIDWQADFPAINDTVLQFWRTLDSPGPLLQYQLDNPLNTSSNKLKFMFEGLPGKALNIHESTNMTDWAFSTNITTDINGFGQVEIPPTGGDVKYYNITITQ